MSILRTDIAGTRYRFDGLAQLLAVASPARSGDELAGLSATNAEQRIAARFILADLPLADLLAAPLIPYEEDEVTRLICDGHDAAAFRFVSHLTVGAFREWLLSDEADGAAIAAVARGLMLEMAAAVSKLMRNQDLISVSRKIRVVTRFRNTIGLAERLSVRLQPNHPTDDPAGIAASALDGLLMGAGDAVIGINPATDNVEIVATLLHLLDDIRLAYAIPTQSCVLAHVTTTLELIRRKAPVDLCFQSIAGTERANRSFGFDLALLREAQEATVSLNRGTVGADCMYFETGRGRASPPTRITERAQGTPRDRAGADLLSRRTLRDRGQEGRDCSGREKLGHTYPPPAEL